MPRNVYKLAVINQKQSPAVVLLKSYSKFLLEILKKRFVSNKV